MQQITKDEFKKVFRLLVQDIQGNLLCMFDMKKHTWLLKAPSDDALTELLVGEFLDIEIPDLDIDKLYDLQQKGFFNLGAKIDKHLDETDDWLDYYYPSKEQMKILNALLNAYKTID